MQLMPVQASPVLLVLYSQGDQMIPPGGVACLCGNARENHQLLIRPFLCALGVLALCMGGSG